MYEQSDISRGTIRNYFNIKLLFYYTTGYEWWFGCNTSVLVTNDTGLRSQITDVSRFYGASKATTLWLQCRCYTMSIVRCLDFICFKEVLKIYYNIRRISNSSTQGKLRPFIWCYRIDTMKWIFYICTIDMSIKYNI